MYNIHIYNVQCILYNNTTIYKQINYSSQLFNVILLILIYYKLVHKTVFFS